MTYWWTDADHAGTVLDTNPQPKRDAEYVYETPIEGAFRCGWGDGCSETLPTRGLCEFHRRALYAGNQRRSKKAPVASVQVKATEVPSESHRQRLAAEAAARCEADAQAITQYVAETGGPTSKAEICKALELTGGRWQRAAKHTLDQGWLTTVNKKYVIPTNAQGSTP